MDPARKPGFTRGLVTRVLLFGVAALLLRFAYVITVRGGACTSASDFCLFSSPEAITVPGAAASSSSAAFLRSAAGGGAAPALWTTREWRRAVDFYSSGFQNLLAEGFLSPSSKALCVGTVAGHEVLALKEMGVTDSIGISKKKSPPLVVSGDLLRQPFRNSTFDFVLIARGNIESYIKPADLATEIVRIVKPEGFVVIHTNSAGDEYSLKSLLVLFPGCRMLRSRDTNTGVREIVLQKEEGSEFLGNSDPTTGLNSNSGDAKCSVQEHKLHILMSAEPLIEEEPPKPWITLKQNIKNVKYLPTMVDISFKRRYVYIDVGARSYGSSIGSWFKKQYPKQNHTFEVYAVEADPAFQKEYVMKKNVKLLPYAAWIRNESLSFEINHDPDKKVEANSQGMGRIRPSDVSSEGLRSGEVHSVKGFDFAEWLKATVSEKDFVVMKMDVEGTEFDLIPRLFETGAICLVDELFLECHYNRWQRCCPGERTPKYKNTYEQCLDLFTSLRDNGVLVHQWW